MSNHDAREYGKQPTPDLTWEPPRLADLILQDKVSGLICSYLRCGYCMESCDPGPNDPDATCRRAAAAVIESIGFPALVRRNEELVKAMRGVSPILGDVGYFDGVDLALSIEAADSLGKGILRDRYARITAFYAVLNEKPAGAEVVSQVDNIRRA